MKLSLWIVIALITIALGVMPVAVTAQEATVTPVAPVTVVQPGADTTVIGNEPVTIVRDDNPALIATLIIAALIIAFLIYERKGLTEKLAESLPPSVRDWVLQNKTAILTNTDQGFDTLDSVTAMTPTTLDDLLAKFSREGVHAIIDAMYDDLERQKTGGTPAPSTTTTTTTITGTPS